LAATERAQEEFFHLFEALRRRGARIVLAADRSPAELEGVEERLRSRFEGGLVIPLEGDAFEGGAVGGGAFQEAAPAPLEAAGAGVEATESPGVPLGAPSGGLPPPAARHSPWTPPRERVVWDWPTVEDRIVDRHGD
jgi:hypothetical protein